MTGTPIIPNEECCLPDVRIAELTRVREFSYDDLLVIDQKKGGDAVYETRSITWGHLTGIYPPGYDPEDPDGGDGGDEINNDIILRGTVKFLDGTELRPSITFIKDDNTGIYRPGDNTIGFTTGGTTVVGMVGEYVGIGTLHPNEKLTISQGNIALRLGGGGGAGAGDGGGGAEEEFNVLFLGASDRSLGGNPTIQSLGDQSLTFFVNQKEHFRFNEFGAWGIRKGYNASDFDTPDFGTPTYLLQSRGENDSPTWANPADIWDLSGIIHDIDTNYIGKGPMYVYPQQTVVGTTAMSSGLDYTVRKSADGEDPNANVFKEAGWELNVDETVVRTDGEQNIKNKKHFVETGAIYMEDTTVIVNRPGSAHDFHNKSTLTLGANSKQYLHHLAEFMFEQLDWIGDAT